MRTADVLQRNFRTQIPNVSKLQSGTRDIAHLQIAAIELFDFALWNLYRYRDVLEAVPNQRKARFVRADSRVLLPAEAGIHQEELPCRRGLSGDDAELSSVDMNVARLVAYGFDSRSGGAEMKIGVRNKSMLRHIETHRNGGWVPFLQLKIDIGYGTVKSKFAGVRDGLPGRRSLVGKPQHVMTLALLKSGCVFPENEDRPLGAESDEPDARPDMNRMAKTIASFRNEHHAMMRGLLHVIDRTLQRVGIVRYSVFMRAESLGRQIHGMGIFGPGTIYGLRGSDTGEDGAHENKDEMGAMQ